MAKPLHRLQRLIRRAQLLLLLLSAVYIMAGSILMLQRPSAPVSQWAAASLQSVSYPSRAPQSAHRASGADWYHGGSGAPRLQDVDAVERSRKKTLDRRLLRRRWFHSKVVNIQPPIESRAFHGPGKQEGTYMGCFVDDAKTHTLGGTVLYDFRKMTITLCQDTCTEGWWGLSRLRWTGVKRCTGSKLFIRQERDERPSRTLNAAADSLSLRLLGLSNPVKHGFRYAGLGYGAECHCGNRITGPQTRPEECSLDCKGEKGSPCGGVERLSVYKLDKKPPGQRRHSSLHYQGCFKKPSNVTGAFIHTTDYDLALEACVEDCTEKEFPLAGVRGLSCLCVPASSVLTQNHREEESKCTLDIHTTNTGTTVQELYQVYHTPALDARCKERMFLPEPSTSLVALSSFPGAGNTWLRHLIELSTGFYTGSFYFDGALFNGGFKGEKDYWKKGRTICVKTHESGQREIEAFDEGILLLRNPYHSLVAEFNRKCGGHVGYATERHWRSKDWPEFVEGHASWWLSHTLSWLKFCRRLLVVHFEDLRADLLSQLQLLTSFLNASISEDRLLCAESNRDGLFKRSGPRKPTFDPYTPQMRMRIDSYIVKVDRALRDRKFKGLPQEYLPR